MKKLIILSSITLVISTLATYFFIAISNSYSIDSTVTTNELTTLLKAKLLFQVLFYFSMLIILPFFNTKIIEWSGLEKKEYWKILTALEIVVLAFSYTSTPSDLASTIIMFIACQLIVIVNAIAFWKTLTLGKN